MPEIIKTRRVTVTAQDGTGDAADADILLCGKCDSDGPFYVYLVLVHGGKHQHLQCSVCQQSYCDGGCSNRIPT